MTAKEIFETMYSGDEFSKWLGVEMLEISEGYCKLKMVIREEMLNGFSIAHGGIAYSLADSAFAFASNSYGRKSVSIETSISHTKALIHGEIIIAEAKALHIGNKTAIFDVKVYNQHNDIVALFKGTVYRTSKEY
jgi:acyl-CoA thioesterase